MKQQLIYFSILILLNNLAAYQVCAARPNTAPFLLSGGAQPDDRKKSSSWSKLASKPFSLTGKVIGGTAKQSSKAALYLIGPKHIELDELIGLWRLDQQVDDLEAIANIELTPQHEVIVRASNGQIYKSTFHFSGARTWPKSAKVEFVARAFSIDDDNEPLRFFYKGYVHRKVADTSVIKLRGQIYRIEAAGWRGRQERYVPVGTFVARRRMKLDDDEDNIDDESEYDEEPEEDEWHEGEESEEEERSEEVEEDEYDEYDYEED